MFLALHPPGTRADGHAIYKKTLRASEQDRPDVQEARTDWAEKIKGWALDRLVIIGESGAKTNMTRFRGRAPRGSRAHDSAPLCRWTVRTMISSIRMDGSKACMASDAPTDGDVFQAFTEQVRVPALRPGDVVVMDNLGVHRRESPPRSPEPEPGRNTCRRTRPI